MGKFVFGVIGLLLGGIGGATLFGGFGLGAGIATGLSAGVCSTVLAAQDEGLLTPEQIDQILIRAARDFTDGVDLPEDAETAGSAAECVQFMENLKATQTD